VIASSGAEDVCAVWGRGFGDVDALSAVAAGRGAAMIVRFARCGGPSCSDKNQCCKEMRTELMGKCHGDDPRVVIKIGPFSRLSLLMMAPLRYGRKNKNKNVLTSFWSVDANKIAPHPHIN
jgi:hypothetical protein